MNMVVNSGDVYLCDFNISAYGSMQGGVRPCIIIDNKMAGAFSPCIHCVPLTSQDKKELPLHYILDATDYDFLNMDSVVLCEQYTLIDKSQLKDKIGEIVGSDIIRITDLCKKNFPFAY